MHNTFSAADIIEAFSNILQEHRWNWETFEADLMLQMKEMSNKPLDPAERSEGYFYVQYSERDFQHLMHQFKIMPDRNLGRRIG